MAKQRELRDPIHGFIQRSDLETKLIDTEVFQRLRGIKQLAMAHLVYPGALHTRFDHSIGVMHVAWRLAEQLIDDAETRRLIRLTALLHDIGHGPFSHVSEDILDRYYDRDKIKPKAKEKIHEHLTCAIIERNGEIAKLLSEKDRTDIIGLLLGTNGELIVRGIISGPLDADKQDYLLRDSYFCGVKYGVFDLERLIGTLQKFPDGLDQVLAASTDGVYAIEQFVLAKYHMTTQVYRHKIRLVTDAMIVRALELGIESDGLEWLVKLHAYDGSDEFIENFLEWDDARITTALLYPLGPSGLASDLFWRLKKRRLFKTVFTTSSRDIADPVMRKAIPEKMKTTAFRNRIENAVAEYLSSQMNTSIPPYHVIGTVLNIKSARKQSRDNESSIIIVKEGSRTEFDQESTLFRSINEEESVEFLEVYAPVTFSDEADKRRKLAEFSKGIQKILEEAATLELTNKSKEGEEDVTNA